jgi:hypothetical protein
VRNENAKKSAQRRQQFRKLKGMIEDDLAHDVHVDDPYGDSHRRWSEQDDHGLDDFLERRADINEHGSRHAGSAFLQHLDEDHDSLLKSLKGRWRSEQIKKFFIAWREFEHSQWGHFLTENKDVAEQLRQHLVRAMT